MCHISRKWTNYDKFSLNFSTKCIMRIVFHKIRWYPLIRLRIVYALNCRSNIKYGDALFPIWRMEIYRIVEPLTKRNSCLVRPYSQFDEVSFVSSSKLVETHTHTVLYAPCLCSNTSLVQFSTIVLLDYFTCTLFHWYIPPGLFIE